MSPMRKTFAELFRLAAPLAVVAVGLRTMAWVDGLVAGAYSATALGAVGVGSGIYFAGVIFGIGVMVGTETLISQSIGAQKPGVTHNPQSQSITRQSLWLASILSLPIALVIGALALTLEWVGIDHELATSSRHYIFARLLGLCPILWSISFRSLLQSHKSLRTIVYSTAVANILNYPLNVVLTFGDDGLEFLFGIRVGLPPLGEVGLGIATTLASMVLCSGYALGARKYVHYFFERIQIKTLKLLWRTGWPIGGQLLAEVGIFAGAAVVCGTFGQSAAAAHTIALNYASMSFSACMGISSAAAVLVGRAVGAKDTMAVKRSGYAALLLATGFMGVSAIAFIVFDDFLVRLLSSDPKVISLAISLLWIAAIFQLTDGLQSVGSGILRGRGLMRFSFAANVIGHWLIGVPVGLILAYGFSLQAIGVWWGLTVGLSAVAIALVFRFQRSLKETLFRLE